MEIVLLPYQNSGSDNSADRNYFALNIGQRCATGWRTEYIPGMPFATSKCEIPLQDWIEWKPKIAAKEVKKTALVTCCFIFYGTTDEGPSAFRRLSWRLISWDNSGLDGPFTYCSNADHTHQWCRSSYFAPKIATEVKRFSQNLSIAILLFILVLAKFGGQILWVTQNLGVRYRMLGFSLKISH